MNPSQSPSDQHLIPIESLTAEAFAPFGDVIEIPNRSGSTINDGTAKRYDDVAILDLVEQSGRPLLSIFHVIPIQFPFRIQKLERHPLSSQAFMTMDGSPFLAVVAPPDSRLEVEKIRAFRVEKGQGINFRRGTWHHTTIAINQPTNFFVIGRSADDVNCDVMELTNVPFLFLTSS